MYFKHNQQYKHDIDNLSTLPNKDFQAREQQGSSTCWKVLPQIIFFLILIVLGLFCIFDFQLILKLFNQFIEWVKLHPYQSISYSIYLLCVSIVFTLPISYTIVMLGYTYCQVFDSKLYGFLFSVPIIYFGCLAGALCSFLLSRYLFRDFIKEQI